ncbi:glutathione-independent glyoxalase hsp3102-like [Haliotis rubra]|uniref:glutathione-independent glyoxalase hsp3102-like n=1 Tax=Haliotis rubra TaxID=36100 RepID=UPI001EE4F568|nr:glutathione-independent glyoxalase hsp3102-like [Haliotis rubra]XP_046554757.1 glutathione-independent glyoxalase hsp3102-like [Haliotis rubra]
MKVLLVVTNHDQLGNTGKKTGWYLPEVAHPYDVFKKAGHDIVFVSPRGGKAPLDPGSYEAFKDDPVCKALLEDKTVMSQLDNTKSPSQVNASEFKVIFYAGGHGPMFDLPQCDAIGKLGAQIYQSGGIVSAVCHGTVGLIPIRLDNGDSILKGQTVTSFTNAEEEAVKLMEAMPFPLETRLKEYGAKFVGMDNFAPNVQVSGRIVTGQNPASATPTAESILKQLR